MDGDDNAPQTRDPVLRWRKILPVLFALALIASLSVLVLFVQRASSERDAALAHQKHSYEVVVLTRTMANAESLLARYVISMDAAVGRQYQNEWARAGLQIKRLRDNIADNPAQAALVDRLAQAYARRGALLNGVALRTNHAQRMGALGRFHQAGKDESLTRIGTLMGRIIANEIRLLEQRSRAVDATRARTELANITYTLFGLLLLLGLLGLAWATNEAMADRRSPGLLAETEANRAAELEAAVAARTNELNLANHQLKEAAQQRAEAEEHLHQLQKLEAIGQMTGGIAHDFNNMLAIIVGGLELARSKLSDHPDQADQHLNNALEGAERASALTRQLLAFARPEPLLPSAVNPHDLIAGMRDLIDRTIGDQIEVETKAGAASWAVWVDHHQLENAILNLAVNACDAMDGRGRLTIATDQVRVEAGELGDRPAGDYVTVAVADTGCGMTPEVFERAFEPFFTTKSVGKGTGLGLSQIFAFMRTSDGEIRIKSSVGAGTQVTLYLPRLITMKAGNATAKRPCDMTAALQPLSILVVEDDPRVLRGTMNLLHELGHKAHPCDHPAKARGLLESDVPFDLILSDVLMPEMTGPEMIDALPPVHADIPVLFVTGYAGDVADASMFRDHPVLRKPFTLASLTAAIALAVNGPNRATAIEAAE